MAMLYSFEPHSHNLWLIYLFLVVIVGGVGSIAGTVIAALLIGLVIGITSALIPLTWTNLVLFGIIIVLLLVRPTGLVRQ